MMIQIRSIWHRFWMRRGMKCVVYWVGFIALIISFCTLSNLFSMSFDLTRRADLCRNIYTLQHKSSSTSYSQSRQLFRMKQTMSIVLKKIEGEADLIRAASSRNDGSLRSSFDAVRYGEFLVDLLDQFHSIRDLLGNDELQENDIADENLPSDLSAKEAPGESGHGVNSEFFWVEELRKYISMTPNRLGKQNFYGANGTFTSIGHACFMMKDDLEQYMEYDVGDYCKDDWKLGQRLMVHGCDPLPRRRCLARAPQYYTKPFPVIESTWRLPDDRNVRWSNYICKNFTCLSGNQTRKGFFKCSDCFNLKDHEWPRWMKKLQNSNMSTEADFLVHDVLKIKPGEIRIGLDFSAGTGTFAARMKEFNVTIVTATINLGAPFSETIALRGFIPIYLTLNQRIPFFDNTLDIIHTTRLLDGWIDFRLLEFVIYDWDRVLRPGGLLWIDSFFCLKSDLRDYQAIFMQLRYKQHRWVAAPKLDKDDNEVYFSAVLEKPPRPF